MQSLYDCLESKHKYGYEKEYFWISGVALVLVGCIGLIGNILNLVVLCRKKFRKKVFYHLLIEMACFDILFILSYGIYVGYQSMACHTNYNYNIGYITYPFLNVGLTGSIYSTVAVSVERYLGMCHPHLKYSRKTWIYIVSVATISISYNFPRFFEHQYAIVNGTLVSTKALWAKSDTYKDRYHMWTPIFIENVIPTTLLLLLNGAIVRMLYCSSKDLRIMAGNNDRNNRATSTKTLLAIVIVFLLCHIPCVTYKLLYYLGSEEDDYRHKWYFIVPIKKLALMTNSSVNVIIYCFVGTKFRDEFLYLLGWKTAAPVSGDFWSWTSFWRVVRYH